MSVQLILQGFERPTYTYTINREENVDGKILRYILISGRLVWQKKSSMEFNPQDFPQEERMYS